jgi:uncharacterized protein YcbK (DUF882 family)
MPKPIVETEHFNETEFYCHCNKCKGKVRIPDEYLPNLKRLLDKLETARSASKIPFNIISGYRCPNHPESKNNPKSAHTTAEAADIEVKSDSERYMIATNLDLAGITRLGVADKFVHGDVCERLSNCVLWLY